MKYLGVLLCGMLLISGLTGCVVSKRGPRFDARDRRDGMGATNGNLMVVSNLTSVANTNRIDPAWLRPSTDFYRLGPGDRVEIELMQDPSSRTVTPVAPDGKIYFYLLPGVDVWGLTLTEARQRMEEQLKEFLREPQVSLQLRGIDSTRVWVLGRVQNPGVYPVGAPMTLLEAITLAGGAASSSASGTTEDLADLGNAFVIRNGERLPIDFEALLNRGDMTQNIYLDPDDFVYIPSSLSKDIYVLGAVRQPKAVQRQHGSLAAAIADAGGPVKDAYLSQVAIVRGSMSNPKIAIVDYEKIVRGKAPDVILDARDIVYVPLSPYRFLNKYLDLITLTFARAVGINEGARAVSPSAAGAGVSIPVGIPLTPAPAPPVITR